MTYRKILAPVFGVRRDQATLESAFELAKRFGSHVEVLFVQADPTAALPTGYMADMGGTAAQYVMEAAIKANETAQKSAEQSFAKVSDRCGIPISTQPSGQAGATAALKIVQGDFMDEIERHSRLCDLVVFAGRQKDLGKTTIHEGFESALMSGSRPVLFVPQQMKSLPCERVAIAYDGSAAAAHALTAAIPFLERAKQIHAFEVTAEKGTALPELQAYLSLRGLKAISHVVPSGGRSTGEALVQAAKTQECDLMILGGYGHSRLREFVFGGVTRHVLRHGAPFAVLLAH
jgi:nucleotide-binding universal stress UspA family protein